MIGHGSTPAAATIRSISALRSDGATKVLLHRSIRQLEGILGAAEANGELR